MSLFGKKKPKPLMNAQEAADYLNISLSTLREAEKSGALRPYRPVPGGHRRYSVRMLNEYLEKSRRK